jgi:hypothetical protein
MKHEAFHARSPLKEARTRQTKIVGTEGHNKQPSLSLSLKNVLGSIPKGNCGVSNFLFVARATNWCGAEAPPCGCREGGVAVLRLWLCGVEVS